MKNIKDIGPEKKILIAATISILLSGLVYQNCSNPALPNANSLGSIGATIDFPYDSQIDQIAYMSCNQMTSGAYDPSAYFTFRVGAYRAGSGVEITSAFKSNIHVSGGAIADQGALLSNVGAAAAAKPQLAIRSFSNFQIPYLATASSSGTDGQDYTTFFTPMDDPDFGLAVLNAVEGDGIKYVRNETPQGARFEGAIALNSSYPTAVAIQQTLNGGSSLLAVTYIGQSGGYQARAPADYGLSNATSGTSVYGRGYQLTFRQPVGSSSGYPINTLASVSEINLENRGVPTNGGTWTCDPSLQFRILRSNLNSDLALAGCTMSVDDPTNAKLAIVRNSFKVEDWYVDMTNRCLIPKKVGAGCYNSTTGIPANTPPSANNTYPNDFINYNIASLALPPGNNNNIYVEFGSICYR